MRTGDSWDAMLVFYSVYGIFLQFAHSTHLTFARCAHSVHFVHLEFYRFADLRTGHFCFPEREFLKFHFSSCPV